MLQYTGTIITPPPCHPITALTCHLQHNSNQPGEPGIQNQGRSREQHRDLKADRQQQHRARTDNQVHSAREPETLSIRTMDRPDQTKGADIREPWTASSGWQEERTYENFEDIYTCRGMASQLSYHFGFWNMILWILRKCFDLPRCASTASIWHVSIFTCRLIIVPFWFL
jgi:hypothetical protein